MTVAMGLISNRVLELRVFDSEYWVGHVEKITEETKGFSFSTVKGWGSLYVPAKHNIKLPSPGTTVTYFGKGSGYTIRGLIIGQNIVWYRTPAEEDIKYQREQEENIRRKKEEFEQQRPSLDATYNWLPKPFKQRLDKFRYTNPDFRWENEGYEMFCVLEAIKMLAHFRTSCYLDAWVKLPYTKKGKFSKRGHKKQQQLFPQLSDGHSGNTFDIAVMLAQSYLTNPKLVVLQHGALTPLMGCDRYGCPHPLFSF